MAINQEFDDANFWKRANHLKPSPVWEYTVYPEFFETPTEQDENSVLFSFEIF